MQINRIKDEEIIRFEKEQEKQKKPEYIIHIPRVD
jgi:hypothetical protein